MRRLHPRPAILSLASVASALALALAGCAPGTPAPGTSGGGQAASGQAPGATATPAYVQQLPADQVDTWRGVHYDGLVLDVRNAGEWDDDVGHLDGAVLIPLPELEQRLGEIERFRDKPVLVYCRVGARSFTAGQILVRNGFKDVQNMEGGLAAYRKLPTSPPAH
jgi:rhodanese-related sulfurtransferase